jgi:hypothetical protein
MKTNRSKIQDSMLIITFTGAIVAGVVLGNLLAYIIIKIFF